MSAPPIAPDALPSWLPAMFVKDLRQGLRTRGFIAAFIGFQVLMVLFMLGTIYTQTDMDRVGRRSTLPGGEAAFWLTLGAILLAIIPGRGIIALRPEIDGRSVDLLVLSRLSASRIVFGKWAALVAQGALLLVAVLPYGIVRYYSASANLVADGAACLLLLGGCGLLTAAAMWASSVPRFLGSIIGLAAAAGIGSLGFWLIQDRTSPLYSGMALPSGLSPLFLVPVVLDGLLLTLFCLVCAVRRIAPPAENHSPLTRLLGLVAVASYPVIGSLGSGDGTVLHFLFLAVFLPLVCLVELASPEFPLAIHLRKFSRFGALGRMLVPVSMPGWPSAVLYTVLLTALVLAVALGFALPEASMRPTGVSGNDIEEFLWTTVLIGEALIFPPLVLSIFAKSGARWAPLYLVVLVSMAIIGATGLILRESFRAMRDLNVEIFTGALPVAGIIVYLGEPSDELVALQAAILAVVIILAIAQTQPYWLRLRELALKRPKFNAVSYERGVQGGALGTHASPAASQGAATRTTL